MALNPRDVHCAIFMGLSIENNRVTSAIAPIGFVVHMGFFEEPESIFQSHGTMLSVTTGKLGY